VKRAPAGFYTAREAQERLGLAPSTFHSYAKQGKIRRVTLPLRSDAVYDKREIDDLANQLHIFLHTEIDNDDIEESEDEEIIIEHSPHMTFRVARPEDAEGIVFVLEVMGWPTTTADQRREWYLINPLIDFVVVAGEAIAGYIHAAPYTPLALADLMSGKRQSRNMHPEDFLPYTPERIHDIYIGIATRADLGGRAQRTAYGRKLISGFLSVLEEWAEQHIYIRRIYAVSAESDGQKLSRGLGFKQQPKEPGDRFPRFMIDLEASDSLFAVRYREAMKRSRTA